MHDFVRLISQLRIKMSVIFICDDYAINFYRYLIDIS